MGLWNRFRTLDATGTPTPVHATEMRLSQRREGFKQALAERDTLAARDQDLLDAIAGIDAMLDVSQPHEQDELRRKQADARAEREPLRRRLEEIDAALPERERRIQEDEIELQRLQFKQKCADRDAWIQAEREERKVFEDLLLRLSDSVRKLANWETMIRSGQQELAQESRHVGLSFGELWEGEPVAAEARRVIAEAWNQGSVEREKVIATVDPDAERSRPATVVQSPRIPTKEGSETWTDETGEHTWSSVPLEAGSQAACNEKAGCNQPGATRLSYVAPKHHRETIGCDKHSEEFVERYIRRPQARMATLAGSR